MLHRITVNEETYLLLKKLFTIPILKSKFALAGGTSLSLQIGHRQSIDLDLFSTEAFSIKELEIVLNTTTDLESKFRGENSKMYFAEINDVKCDFIHEPARLIQPFLYLDDIPFFSVPDIAAMKLHTICGRGKKKDFYDLFCLLQLYKWDQLVSFFEQKYSSEELTFLWRSMLYFEDAESDPDIISFSPFQYSWSHVKHFILANCRAI
jgi:predicted nucleotidyltransferase component of viral defense system